jgi:hypothetical protein
MNAFLLYVVQSALCLSLFYGLYLLLLRHEAFFRFKRSVLLAIMASSMILPLVRVPVAEPALPMIQSFQNSKIQLFQDSKIQLFQDSKIESFQGLPTPEIFESRNFEIYKFIPLAYLAGLFVSVALALVSLISVRVSSLRRVRSCTGNSGYWSRRYMSVRLPLRDGLSFRNRTTSVLPPKSLPTKLFTGGAVISGICAWRISSLSFTGSIRWRGFCGAR